MSFSWLDSIAVIEVKLSSLVAALIHIMTLSRFNPSQTAHRQAFANKWMPSPAGRARQASIVRIQGGSLAT